MYLFYSHSHITVCEKAPLAAYHSTLQWYILPMSVDRLYFLYASQMMWYYSSQEWFGSATWISIKAGLWRWMRGEGTRQKWACNPSPVASQNTAPSAQSDEHSFFGCRPVLVITCPEKSHQCFLLQKQARLKCQDNLLNRGDRLNCRTLTCRL